MRIESLFTYPVKGFSPMPLETARLEKGGTLPADRAYAVSNGPLDFDPEIPAYLPKVNFLCLMRNERMAAYNTHLDPATGHFAIKQENQTVLAENIRDPDGRLRIESWIAAAFAHELSGPPKILHANGHTFSDYADRVVHLINRASLRDLQSRMPVELNPARFRANIVVDGIPPLAELDWIGATLRAGDTALEAIARTKRCAATNVDPETGMRDAAIPRTLLSHYGHSDFGIYLKVAAAGTLTVGDILEITEPR